MNNNLNNFEQREVKCERCGNTYKKTHITFGDFWVGDCECVISERKADEERAKEIKRQRKIENNINESGIPKLYRDSNLNNFIERKGTENALKAAKIFVNKFNEFKQNGKGLIFTGNTGSGKTRLAASIANSLLNNGYSVKYISFVNIIDSINRAEYNGRAEANLIDELTRCNLLIIDDICVTSVNDRWKRVLFTIIDNRINEVKPTIYTSNIAGVEDIKTILNEQIYDRINGSCVEIKVLASSFRQNKSGL